VLLGVFAYLSNIVRPVDLSRSRAGLRSSSSTNFAMPQLQTKCGERAFSHAGPAAWNALPEDMRAVSDSVLFRKRLKTRFLVLLLTFVDYCCPLLMSLVMHLCSACNIGAYINFYDDDAGHRRQQFTVQSSSVDEHLAVFNTAGKHRHSHTVARHHIVHM